LKFKRLKLNSFKSFVDPVDFEIQDGLTGIVGPNGCGKSNVVEAFRWVMGETSAKQMRGEDMDDIIFGGSSNRPPRDIAEATVVIDNSEIKSVSQFSEYDELEVKRRIERGKGSTWTINANSVRAKDVNLLFADNSTGAKSSGIVSQGQVSNLISAKPEIRRGLLEEAANITGLHHRRHEAELRLNAAETNLHRLEDIVITMGEQKKSLSKQARQASRYRSVGDRLRKAEATLLTKKHEDKSKGLEEINDSFKREQNIYIEISRKMGAAEKDRVNVSGVLPELRKKETENQAVFQNLKISLSNIENELTLISDSKGKAKNSLNNIKENIDREERLNSEAIKVIEKLNNENEILLKDLEKQEENYKKENQKIKKIKEEVVNIEKNQTTLITDINSNKLYIENLENEKIKLSVNIESLQTEYQDLTKNSNNENVKILKNELIKINKIIDTNEKKLSEFNKHMDGSTKSLETTKKYFEKLSYESRSLEAEYEVIDRILQFDKSKIKLKLSQKIKVKEGYEASVSSVLGDSLEGSLNESEQPHWNSIEPINNFNPPENIEPLINFIDNPSLAKYSLTGVGIVKTEHDAKLMQASLLPGQAITTEKGGLWRWDGFVIPINSKSSSEEILKQNRRLRTIEKERTYLKTKLEKAENEYRSSEANYFNYEEKTKTTAQLINENKEKRLNLEFELNEKISKEKSTNERKEIIQNEIKECKSNISQIDIILRNKDKSMEANKRLEKANKSVEEIRLKLSNSIGLQAKLEQNKVFCSNRIIDIKKETAEWSKRSNESLNQISELLKKQSDLNNEIINLTNKPDELTKKRSELLTETEIIEAECKKSSEKLLITEKTFNEADLLCRNLEIELRTANENKVRAESQRDLIENELKILVEQMSNKFNCSPKEIKDLMGIKEDLALLTYDDLETKINRLIRERDAMGPVNLRAEIEMEELEEQISNILKESEDLESAINKLRDGIKTLNREGKERILVAFNKVQNEFENIFKKLYGGGEARLHFTDENDPLNSGLEIMARPPGKKLQTLSLLSGGEKALTAISLLFAVFLTNPSPICILDEVDAPLDDTNVAKFCDLLEEIKLQTNTRFMIITHHRLTMARMDRLYGVTMSEKGVSQLVSVNLEKAIDLKETA